jgi:hypothetical protein
MIVETMIVETMTIEAMGSSKFMDSTKLWVS